MRKKVLILKNPKTPVIVRETEQVCFASVRDVCETWDIICKIPNYAEVAGELLFRKIFELAPAVMGMFSFAADGYGLDDAEFYKNEAFLAHARAVVGMLDAAVNMLGPDLEPLALALFDLGAIHVKLGVLPAHYGIVGEALLCTLAAALGDKNWTPEVKKGWAGIYTFISSNMILGADNYLTEQRERKMKREASKMKQNSKLQRSASTPTNLSSRRAASTPDASATSSGRVRAGRRASTSTSCASTVSSSDRPGRRTSTSTSCASTVSSSDRPARIRGPPMKKSQRSSITRLLNSTSSAPRTDTSNDAVLQEVRLLDPPTADDSSSIVANQLLVVPRRVSLDPDGSSSSTGVSCATETTTDMDHIDYYQMVLDVYMTWDIVKRIPNYCEVAGVLLFKKIFEIAPAAKGLFSFTAGYAADDDALYENPDFLEHARTVVRMLDATVNMLGPDLEPVSSTLEDLGQRHVAYGVLPAHYAVVGEALMFTLEAALGDAWTATVREGWSGIYSFVSTTMIRGANTILEEKKKDEAIMQHTMGIAGGTTCTGMSEEGYWDTPS